MIRMESMSLLEQKEAPMLFALSESGVCQVDLIDLENGSRAPGRVDKAAQESAQNAADTMQASAQSLTQARRILVAHA